MTQTTETASLLLPDPALSGCIFAAIRRDTRAVTLGDAQRFNHFPASPLVALTCIFHGETRALGRAGDPGSAPVFPAVSVAGPQSRPLTSWNPGPVHALSVGFYPDAWARLTGTPAQDLADRITADLPAALAPALDALQGPGGFARRWAGFQARLGALWHSGPAPRRGARLADWAHAVTARAALSGPGRSLRAAQRRLRRWTGQNRQTLNHFSRIEDLHQIVSGDDTADLAGLAVAAGFSDQSHMGRELRRATGFSPQQLNRLIETEEAFWCYRLLGERF
jgi:hypothetical protein